MYCMVLSFTPALLYNASLKDAKRAGDEKVGI
jgi:hypothetical protein